MGEVDGASKLSGALNVRFVSAPRPSALRTSVGISRHGHRPFKFLDKNTSLTLTRGMTNVNSLTLYPKRVTINVGIDNARMRTIDRNSAIATCTGLMRGNEALRA